VCARTRVHICLCVFTREREREREIKRDRESERERDREACSGGHLITEHVNFGSKHGIPRQAAIATRTHARTHAHTRTRTRTRHTHGFRCFELQVRLLGLDRRGERGGFSGAGWRPDKERSAEEEGEEEERGGERRREEEEDEEEEEEEEEEGRRRRRSRTRWHAHVWFEGQRSGRSTHESSVR
jgi:hypothetical protein